MEGRAETDSSVVDKMSSTIVAAGDTPTGRSYFAVWRPGAADSACIDGAPRLFPERIGASAI